MTDAGASINPSIAAMQASTMQTRVEGSEGAISPTSLSSQEASKVMIGNLEEFRAKYPELYKAITESLAQEMMRKSQRANDRIIQKLREQRYT